MFTNRFNTLSDGDTTAELLMRDSMVWHCIFSKWWIMNAVLAISV